MAASDGAVPGLKAGFRRVVLGGGGRPVATTATATDLASKKRQAAMNVELGSQSGPALAVVRRLLGRVQTLADTYQSKGKQIALDPAWSDAGRSNELNKLKQASEKAINDEVAEAGDHLNEIARLFPRVSPLGTELVLPPNRAPELQAVATMLSMGTFGQWRNLAQRAMQSNDRPLAEVVSFIGRANSDKWGPSRAYLENDLATLEQSFATPATLAGEYAAALTGSLADGMTLLGNLLSRPDSREQLAVYAATRSFAAFDPPGEDVNFADLYDIVIASARNPTGSPWVLQADGSFVQGAAPGTAEAAGPVTFAGDAGSRPT